MGKKINILFFLGLILIVSLGCSKERLNQALHGEEQVLRDNPILKKYPIIFTVDREQYGFSPLPEKARISVKETDNQVFLTVINAKSIKEVQLLIKESGEIEWHVEKEDFTGPNVYKGKYIKQHEVIQIWYYGFNKPGRQIAYSYYGEDPVLDHKHPLTLEDIKPYLEKWGF